jgi:hypothetical protein
LSHESSTLLPPELTRLFNKILKSIINPSLDQYQNITFLRRCLHVEDAFHTQY